MSLNNRNLFLMNKREKDLRKPLKLKRVLTQETLP